METRISGGVCNKYVHIDLILNEKSTNTEYNTSFVEWQLVGYMDKGATSSYWYSNNYHSISIKIGGQTVYSLANTEKLLISIGTNHTKDSPAVILSGAVDVPHNNDGSKICSASFSVAYRYSSSFKWSGAGSMALTDIARASALTTALDEECAFEFGKPFIINTNRASTAFTHKLYYAVAGGEDVLIAEGIEDSYKWTVPLDLMNSFPDTTYGDILLKLATYKGNTLLGSNSAIIREGIPADIVPSVTIVCHDPTGLLFIVGNWVQHHSKLETWVEAEGVYSSTIKSCVYEINGVKYVSTKAPFFEVVTLDVLESTEYTVTATVTDSRGRTATHSQKGAVLAYNNPTISKLKAYRCNEDRTLNDEGAYMIVEGIASVVPLEVGGKSCNSKQFILEYKAANDTEWTQHRTYSGGYDYKFKYLIPADVDSTYAVRLTVTDDFNTVDNPVTMTTELPTGYTLMDFNASGKGIAFGKVSEQDAFECAMPAIFSSCTTEAGADLDALAADVAAIKAHLGI